MLFISSDIIYSIPIFVELYERYSCYTRGSCYNKNWLYNDHINNNNKTSNHDLCSKVRLTHCMPLQWRHSERDGVSNHRHLDCSLNRLFKRRSKKTPKLRVTGLCEGNSPETGEFPSQNVSNAENVSIWWRHHGSGPWATTWRSNLHWTANWYVDHRSRLMQRYVSEFIRH